MIAFYSKKIISLITTIILVSLITFLVFQVLPGNPAYIILGVEADPLQIEALEAKLNLDKPLIERYLIWVGDLLRGDLGESIRFQRPVAEMIGSRVEVTLLLTVLSLFLSIIISIPLAIWLALNSEKSWSKWVTALSQVGLAVPSFWLAIILIYIFSIALHWLPAGQYERLADDPIKALQSLILPTIALAIGITAILVRYLRNNLLDQMESEYVRTAMSKGLNSHEILYRHVLQNSLLPMLTILGMITAEILGGSIVVENVFALPGIGNLIAISIGSRDLPLIQALVIYLAIVVVMINFVVDIVYTVIDPRIRLR